MLELYSFEDEESHSDSVLFSSLFVGLCVIKIFDNLRMVHLDVEKLLLLMFLKMFENMNMVCTYSSHAYIIMYVMEKK